MFVKTCLIKRVFITCISVKSMYVTNIDSIERDGDLVRRIPKMKFLNDKIYDACARGILT